jgi:hypothetical protein
MSQIKAHLEARHPAKQSFASDVALKDIGISPWRDSKGSGGNKSEEESSYVVLHPATFLRRILEN